MAKGNSSLAWLGVQARVLLPMAEEKKKYPCQHVASYSDLASLASPNAGSESCLLVVFPPCLFCVPVSSCLEACRGLGNLPLSRAIDIELLRGLLTTSPCAVFK